MKFFKKHLTTLSIFIILISLVIQIFPAKTTAQKDEKDKHVAFLMEVYDTIKTNYWEKITDEQLAEIYRLGIVKLISNTPGVASKPAESAGRFDSPGVNSGNNSPSGSPFGHPEGVKSFRLALCQTLTSLPDEQKKKEFVVTLADIVLANLKPFGRSRLYSAKEEISLSNTVKNTNPDVNQYQILGVEKNASPETIKKAYDEKSQKLMPLSDTQSREKLADLDQAYKVLGEASAKNIYDQTGAEPTLDYKRLTGDIFYIHWKKFSPTTLEELRAVTEKVDIAGGPSTLVLDLRDNIGGIIDGLPYFLGPFVGYDRYAYRFYHQGETTDYKTKLGWLPSLVRYKTVIVLVNNGSQSTAEVMASTLKQFNVGVLVGTKTKGWGTIEKVFPLNTQLTQNERYSAFLVHTLTVREDGQSIEGNGIEPMVDVSKPDWENELYAYTRYPELISQVKKMFSE